VHAQDARLRLLVEPLPPEEAQERQYHQNMAERAVQEEDAIVDHYVVSFEGASAANVGSYVAGDHFDGSDSQQEEHDGRQLVDGSGVLHYDLQVYLGKYFDLVDSALQFANHDGEGNVGQEKDGLEDPVLCLEAVCVLASIMKTESLGTQGGSCGKKEQ